jgi:GH15 family glucan-1,4-alpha-glucosidase
LRCLRGRTECRLSMRVCYEFDLPAASQAAGQAAIFDLDAFEATLWGSFHFTVDGNYAESLFELRQGEEHALTFQLGRATGAAETRERVNDGLEGTLAHWRDWQRGISYSGGHERHLRRSAATLHLMGFAPAGSSVAAPTTSLPERIAGDRNYDYRYAWVRDASLSTSSLAMLGDVESAARYMDWLAGLGSSTDAPLQVAYGIDGGTDLREHERRDVRGYRGSLPVRIGNHAFAQRQLGALGYLADCALLFLEHGGHWKPEYWDLVHRCADYVARTWREEDHGIWELDTQTHHVSSKVMCWVALNRAIELARRTGAHTGVVRWDQASQRIHAEVLLRGWSPRLRAFRQSYGSDTLDASSLLIPLMGFLPPNDERVVATVERLEQRLTINGYLYRFDPQETEGVNPLPLGEFEGAFLPSTFMLAAVYVQMGQRDKAEALLDRVERDCGPLGLFPEEIDSRTGGFLGNAPLLFSHAEHIRAVLALAAP